MTNRQRNILGMLCGFLPEVLFGFSFLCTKRLAGDLDVLSLLSWRFLVAFVGLSIPLLFRVVHLEVTRKNIQDLLIMGLLVPVVYFIGETLGVQRTTTSESSIAVACIPAMTLLFTGIITRCKPSFCETCGIVVTLFGAIGFAVLKGMTSSFNVVGYLGLITAVMSYPFFCIVSTRLKTVSEYTRTYMMTLEGAVVFTILALVRNAAGWGMDMETYLAYPFTAWGHLWPICYLGLGCSVCGFFLFNTGITLIGATRTVAFAGVTPLVAVLVGVFILGEAISGMQVFYSALVIIGITVTNLFPKQGT